MSVVTLHRRTALTLGVATFAAGSWGPPALGAGNSRVLRFVPAINPSSLDSLWAQSVGTREAAFMIFDTLGITSRPGVVSRFGT